jgi:hypothetical protein
VRRYWSPLGSSLNAAPCRRPTSRRDLEPTLPKSCTLLALTLRPVRRCWRPARLGAPIGATSLRLDRSLATVPAPIPCRGEFPRPTVHAQLRPAIALTRAPCRSNAAKRNLRPSCHPASPQSEFEKGRTGLAASPRDPLMPALATNHACAHPMVVWLGPLRIFRRSALRPSWTAS